MAPCSMTCSSALAFSPTAEMAMPANSENTTTCRISFRAIASMMDEGIRCSRKPERSCGGATPASATEPATWATPAPTPGSSRLTITRPINSATNDADRNQIIALVPMRPTVAALSIWPMPAVKVVSTRGAMIILIRRRKMLVTWLK